MLWYLYPHFLCHVFSMIIMAVVLFVFAHFLLIVNWLLRCLRMIEGILKWLSWNEVNIFNGTCYFNVKLRLHSNVDNQNYTQFGAWFSNCDNDVKQFRYKRIFQCCALRVSKKSLTVFGEISQNANEQAFKLFGNDMKVFEMFRLLLKKVHRVPKHLVPRWLLTKIRDWKMLVICISFTYVWVTVASTRETVSLQVMF